MSHNTQNAHDDLPQRYHSSFGVDPDRPKINERDLARQMKIAREEYQTRQALARAIEVRPARSLMRRDLDEDPPQTTPPTILFPPFWHPGQLAVLTGPAGVGLSLLAVQLAECIATGVSSPHVSKGHIADKRPEADREPPLHASPPLFTVHRSPFTNSVLYFDLERTRRQYRELYTHNNRRYRFAEGLNFGLLADEPLPDNYRGRRETFYRDAIGMQLANTEAPAVVIIDNISWLLHTGSPTELRQLLKSFRRYVNETGSSMLLLSNDGASRVGSPRVRSPHVSKGSTFTEFADSVFSLNASTFAPDYRYLKLLKASSQIHSAQPNPDNSESSQFSVVSSQLAPDPVHVLKLTRTSPPPSLTTDYRPPPTSSAAPFPGFEFIGLSPESEHIRDYAAEVRKVEAAILAATQKEERRRKLSAKDALALGVIDGSYQRYLNGE